MRYFYGLSSNKKEMKIIFMVNIKENIKVFVFDKNMLAFEKNFFLGNSRESLCWN